tara:strand:- start:3417 stop:4145 length:729 start_codon:yes stop_codon:yes gene_type:complete
MKKLDKGLGIWQILDEAYITEIIASAGFDLTILDLEHGQHNFKTIQNCVYAAKSSSIKTIVRVPQIFYQNLVQIIDSNIDGLLFPHVETSDQLDKIMKQTLIAPRGEKSFSPFVSKYKFGVQRSNLVEDPSIGIIIESANAINNIEKILKNEFLDFIYFGAYDLSVDLGSPGDIFCDEIKEKLIYVNRLAKKNSKKVFSIFRNAEELKFLKDIAIDFPVASVDTSHLLIKLKREVEEYRKLT